MKKLNASGFAHFMLLAFVVLGAAIFGTYTLVSSRANALAAEKPHLTVTMNERVSGQNVAPTQLVNIPYGAGATVVVSVNIVNSSPTVIKGIRLHATLPSGITSTANSLTLDGKAVSGLLANYSVGDLQPGESKQIGYTVFVNPKLKACGTNGSGIRASVSGSATSTQSASVGVLSCPPNTPKAAPKVVKPEVRTSLTLGARPESQGAFTKDITVLPGNVVQFSAVVTNKSTTTLKNVRIHNTLPGGMIASAGTLQLDGTTVSGLLSNLPLGDLQPGENKELTFSALISPKVAACGTTTLKDGLRVTSNNWPTVGDTITIHSCKQ